MQSDPRTCRGFAGWPTAAFDILLKLDGEPSMEFREQRRKAREQLVRQPMIDLLNDLADADELYEDFFVWSFHKMIWPWQRQVGVICVRRNLELSLAFDLDGLDVHGNCWFADQAGRDRYRHAVDNSSSGEEWRTLLDGLQGAGFDVSGDVMKRVPRDYAKDHPRAELLKHRSLHVVRPLGC
ncbi:MAG: DUF2461 family protein, partial [Mycobacterium sp.]|nr:DUF2461 family protein [Mycobacterium sp.]